MTKQELIIFLTGNHQQFTGMIDSFTEENFLFAPNEKWNAGQQLDHIVKSVLPLTMILGFPKFVIRMMFGKANRKSKTYDELVKKYHFKLEQGGKASGRFIPQQVSFTEKKKLIDRLTSDVRKLNQRLNRFSENELDELILPHPLLGKLTLREMIYFTIYHVQHHQKLILKQLELIH